MASANVFASGAVVDRSFFSPALGVLKNYRVYLPEAYEPGLHRYPVIYLLHGWGVNERSWTDTLQVNEVADRLKLQALIVMPDGDRSLYANAVSATGFDECMHPTPPMPNPGEQRSEYCVKTPQYEDYIVRDLVEEVDAQFRTVANRDGRALTGESAGGFGAFSLALRNPQLFSSAASHSGFLALLYAGPYPYEAEEARFYETIEAEQQSPEIRMIYGDDIENWRSHDPYSLLAGATAVNLSLYLDCGLQDEFQFDVLSSAVHELLTDKHIEHEFHLVPGGHDDDLFGSRIEHSLRFHSRHLTQPVALNRGDQ